MCKKKSLNFVIYKQACIPRDTENIPMGPLTLVHQWKNYLLRYLRLYPMQMGSTTHIFSIHPSLILSSSTSYTFRNNLYPLLWSTPFPIYFYSYFVHLLFDYLVIISSLNMSKPSQLYESSFTQINIYPFSTYLWK